ncbi:MAG: RNA-binding S4 domain-containing protein [Cyanobacteria bacterium J06560_2]
MMLTDFIKLDQFLKITDVARSGGEAKTIIRSGEVSVNGEMEIRRGRKLYDNDVVTVDEVSFTVHLSAESDGSESTKLGDG